MVARLRAAALLLLSAFTAACGGSDGSSDSPLVPGQYMLRAHLPGGWEEFRVIEITEVGHDALLNRYLEPDFSYAEGVNTLQPIYGQSDWVFQFQDRTIGRESNMTLQWRIVPRNGGYTCEHLTADDAGPYACSMERIGPVSAP